MKKIWRVAAYEFRRNVFKRSFLFSLFSIPFFIAFSLGLGFTLESIRKDSQPIGIVDRAGIFGGAVLPAGIQSRLESDYEEAVVLTLFPDEESALAALKAGAVS